jgi:hypothetical protein
MVLCGKSLTPIQGANKYWHAATRNSSTSLHNSYKCAWEASSTWTNGSVWNIPNTLAIDGSTYDWNIVKTNNNVTTAGNKTVLGLLVESNTLEANNNNKKLHII